MKGERLGIALLVLTPLLITLLAATQLGERVTPAQWALVAGSFGGALLVIQPDAQDFKWAMLLPLALVVVNAVYQLLTSRLMREDDAATLQLWTGSVAVAATTLALPWAGPWRVQPQLWGLLVLMGVFSTAGHTMLTMVYGHARAPTLTPFPLRPGRLRHAGGLAGVRPRARCLDAAGHRRHRRLRRWRHLAGGAQGGALSQEFPAALEAARDMAPCP